MLNQDQHDQFLKSYYRLRSGYFLAFPSPEQIQIRVQNRQESVVWLRQTVGEEWLTILFQQMDGLRTLQQLLAMLPEHRYEDGFKVMVALASKGLVERSNAPFISSQVFSSLQQHLLGARQFDPSWLERALLETRVLMIGAGMIGSRVAFGLAHAGVQNLTIWDRQLVTESDQSTSPIYASTSLNQSRAVTLAKFLTQIKRSMAAQSKEIELQETCLREEIKKHDLILVVEDRFSPQLYRMVNQIAIQLDKRWSMILVDGWDVYIGPTFFPRQSGCYECLEQRHISLMKNAASYVSYRDGAQITPNLCWPPLADLVAGYLVSDIIHIIGKMPQRIEPGTGLTMGRQLHINFKSYNAMVHEVGRQANCPICSKKHNM